LIEITDSMPLWGQSRMVSMQKSSWLSAMTETAAERYRKQAEELLSIKRQACGHGPVGHVGINGINANNHCRTTVSSILLILHLEVAAWLNRWSKR
jgi:hypothetical protein